MTIGTPDAVNQAAEPTPAPGSTRHSVADDSAAHHARAQDETQWWRSAVVYQIYPRSFADSNGDGVGDLKGIIDHLDHLVALGVDAVWLSPAYRSPMADNGYDISDYRDIDPIFGDLATMDRLIAEMHARGLRLVMDLVVNHTSDQHAWFRDALTGPDAEHRDWYIWRDPRPGATAHDAGPGQWRGDEPNGWVSAFSGPAWAWDEASGQYYLHIFAPGQPDLNWENPKVRQAVYTMMNWWLARGVDGFRMDVINLISKPAWRPDDGGSAMIACSVGPRLHEFLAEMNREVMATSDKVLMTVGEMPSVTLDEAADVSGRDRHELNMVFQFEHVWLDNGPDGDKYRPVPLRLADMKANMARWAGLCETGWNSLYLGNHDQPRFVSRWGDEAHREQSSTAWAAMLHAHPGTPFIYQGDELGMTDAHFGSIDQYRDVETLGYWHRAVDLDGRDPDEVMAGVRYISRDNARTPVQWTAGDNAGFTTGTPWLAVNPNYAEINAQTQVGVPGSVFEFHAALCRLRHELPVLTDGSIELLDADHPRLWWVRRRLDGVTLDAVANMSPAPLDLAEASQPLPEGRVVLSNIVPVADDEVTAHRLAPWEVRWTLS